MKSTGADYWDSIKDRSKYRNEWVVVVGRNIFHNKDCQKAYEEAKKIIKVTGETPFIEFVVTKNFTLIPGFTIDE